MKLKLAISLIILTALTRFMPHPPNFTPIGAMGLFGAAYLGKKWMALIVPFIALFLSDLVLNNVVYTKEFQGFTMITSVWIYAAFAMVIGAGILLFRNQKVTLPLVITASFVASTIFFIVTNFWSWMAFDMYPKTAVGLVTCFTAAIPFFGNSLLGDLFFSGVMFGTYEYITRKKHVFA
jgi:hypothetical protein